MSGTNSITPDPGSATRWVPKKLRAPAAAVVLFLLIAIILWIARSTWNRVQQVQGSFAAMQTESFYLGVHLRGGIWKLNGMLLRIQLSRNDGERDAFKREAATLNDWLEKTRGVLTSAEARDLAREIEPALKQYLSDTAPFLERVSRPVRKDTAALLHQQLVEKSEALLALCEKLVLVQHADLDRHFAGSRTALGSLHGLLRLSTLLQLMLVAAVAVLIYFMLVIPLRMRLTETQAAVERQEKLAALGVLAAGVAHEIRNPLTAMKLRLFSFKRELPEPLARHEDVVVLHNEINRLERIVQDFLQFARPSEPQLGNVAAAQLLQQVQGLLQPQLQKQAIQLKADAEDGLNLRIDTQQIQQVLINLVQNAAESIGHDGAITLRARTDIATLARKSVPVVMIEVADTGKGIALDAQQRIFDPFFSTKENGTGLGLPIAARIVEKHGGLLQFQSQPNKGTIFSLILPISNHDSAKNTTR